MRDQRPSLPFGNTSQASGFRAEPRVKSLSLRQASLQLLAHPALHRKFLWCFEGFARRDFTLENGSRPLIPERLRPDTLGRSSKRKRLTTTGRKRVSANARRYKPIFRPSLCPTHQRALQSASSSKTIATFAFADERTLAPLLPIRCAVAAACRPTVHAKDAPWSSARHACSQARQAPAQTRQCSCMAAWPSHSVAQIRQASAQAIS